MNDLCAMIFNDPRLTRKTIRIYDKNTVFRFVFIEPYVRTIGNMEDSRKYMDAPNSLLRHYRNYKYAKISIIIEK